MGKILPLESRVPNIEFGQAYTRSVEIAESYEPEELQILTPFTHVKDAISLAAELVAKPKKQALTAVQAASISKMQKQAATLLKHVRALQGEPNQASATDIAHVFHFVEKHLKGLRKSNSYRQVRIIQGMVDEMNQNVTVKQAVETLGFSKFFEILHDEFLKFDTVYKQRRKTLAEKEKARNLKIKRKLYFLLRQLFTAIEVAEIQHPELEYTPLINELNQEIIRCNLSVMQRKKSPEVSQGSTPLNGTENKDAV